MQSILRSKTIRVLALAACATALAAGTAWAETAHPTPNNPLLEDGQREALRVIALTGSVDAWQELNADQLAAVHKKAEYFLDLYQKQHQPYGQHADMYWMDYGREQLARYEHIGDSATWLGYHLAGLAYRYAVTKDAKTLADIHRILDTYDMLIRISGHEGYIVRFAGKADDPYYIPYYQPYGRGEDPERPGYGTWAWRGVEPWEDWVWLGNSSRDTYTGVFLGYACVLAVVDDEAAREKIKTQASLILDRIIADDNSIYDGKQYRTRLTGWLPVMMWAVGNAVAPDKYGETYETLSQQAIGAPTPPVQRHTGDYFANNLRYSRIIAVAVLEKDAERAAAYKRHMEAIWRNSADHLNGGFAAMYAVVCGPEDVTARAVLQGTLYEFWDTPLWMTGVVNSDREDIETVDVGTSKQAKYALMIPERHLSDIIWTRRPFTLDEHQDHPYEFPGLDLYVPYWMGRYAGAIPAPSTAPRDEAAE